MAIFDTLKERLASAGKTAIKASNELIEVAKLNLQIKSEEDKIQARWIEIGKIVYDRYKEGNPIEAELSIKCDDISESEKSIEALKEKILEIKNLRQCGHCSAQVEYEAIYCPKCGAKMED